MRLGRPTWAARAAIAVALGMAAPVALAQDSAKETAAGGEAPVTVRQESDPAATATPVGGGAVPEETTTATPTATPSVTPTPVPGTQNNAGVQDLDVKAREAELSCDTDPPQTSRMFAVGGAVGSSSGGSWPGWLLAIALAVGLATATVYLLRRRGKPTAGAAQPKPSRLEMAGTLVAICTGLAGLGGQFVPGLKPNERPNPDVTMEVRDVHARITRGEFTRALGLPRLRNEYDRAEVGNVIWVKLRMQGYGGRTLKLQWASFDGDNGDLIAGTVYDMDIAIEDGSDVQTLFQPVWVGHPKTERFQVEFRLLEGGAVREMAATGRMRALDYRYACL